MAAIENAFGLQNSGHEAHASIELFWVAEATINSCRQAVIHFGDRSKCNLAQSFLQSSASCQWHGPFSSLSEARENSDSLAGIALRSECRCLPRDPYVSRRMTKLSIPGLRPQALPVRKSRVVEKNKSAGEVARGAKVSPPRLNVKKVVYGIVCASAIAIAIAALLIIPTLSVGDTNSPPFFLSTTLPIPLTDLQADCQLEMASGAMTLRTSHEQISSRLERGERVQVPCFEKGGKGVPETSGLLMNVSLDYKMFGLRHAKQNFQFVAARTPEGFCRWSLKD